MGGNIGLVASIAASPWFNLSLVILGILYIAYVGEARRPLRHPLWPVLGWTVFIVVALAFWSLLVAGYIAGRVSGSRTLTDDQRKKFAEVLRNVSPGETYVVSIQVISSCNACEVYAEDLFVIWKSLPGWDVRPIIINFHLSPRLSGVSVGFDESTCPPNEIRLINEALDAADIKHTSDAFDDRTKKKLSVSCGVFVGSQL